MKTVKMTVSELKHLVTEGGSMSPTMHLKSGASSRLQKTLAGYQKKIGADAFDASWWENTLERLYELEPRSPAALARDYDELYGAGPGDETEAFGPKFWNAVFKAMRADEKARSRRSSYEF